jgi:hypothetical protein
VVAKDSSAPPTTTTTTVPPTAGVAVTTPAPGIPRQYGSLQQPDDASASFAFTGEGSMVVAVSWTPSTTLSLTVTCPSGAQVQQGTTTISMVIPDAEGPCDLSLKEMLVESVPVSYTFTIGPESG